MHPDGRDASNTSRLGSTGRSNRRWNMHLCSTKPCSEAAAARDVKPSHVVWRGKAKQGQRCSKSCREAARQPWRTERCRVKLQRSKAAIVLMLLQNRLRENKIIEMIAKTGAMSDIHHQHGSSRPNNTLERREELKGQQTLGSMQQSQAVSTSPEAQCLGTGRLHPAKLVKWHRAKFSTTQTVETWTLPLHYPLRWPWGGGSGPSQKKVGLGDREREIKKMRAVPLNILTWGSDRLQHTQPWQQLILLRCFLILFGS